MELVYGILVAIALTIILGVFQNRKKRQAWNGTVTKIKYVPQYYDDANNLIQARYVIHYRTDAGKKSKIHVNEHQFGQQFPGLQEGGRLQKQPGKYLPDMVRS
jgi:hypothetical protein